MKKLIVNADDFGLTESVNCGIIYGYKNGIITSTSLMVKRPYAEEAALLAKKNPNLGVGLHFDVEYNYGFDKKGYLDNLEKDESQKTKDFFRNEFLSQLEKFQKLLGRLPTHIDGHHHIQKFASMLDFIQEFSKEKKIPLRDLSGIVRIKTFSTGNPKDVTSENLTKILQNLHDGAFELMTHPGYNSDELEKTSSWSDIRERKLQVLTSPEIKKVIKNEKIELITWENIRDSL